MGGSQRNRGDVRGTNHQNLRWLCRCESECVSLGGIWKIVKHKTLRSFRCSFSFRIIQYGHTGARSGDSHNFLNLDLQAVYAGSQIWDH